MTYVPKVAKAWHDQMVELILLNPTITNAEIAETLGTTPIAVHFVRRSDMFQLLYRERLAKVQEITNEQLKGKLSGQMARLASVALDTLTEQVDAERELLLNSPSRGTRETAEMALQALGYMNPPRGQMGAPAVGNAENVFIVDAELLAQSREKMRSIGNARDEPALIEQEPKVRSAS